MICCHALSCLSVIRPLSFWTRTGTRFVPIWFSFSLRATMKWSPECSGRWTAADRARHLQTTHGILQLLLDSTTPSWVSWIPCPSVLSVFLSFYGWFVMAYTSCFVLSFYVWYRFWFSLFLNFRLFAQNIFNFGNLFIILILVKYQFKFKYFHTINIVINTYLNKSSPPSLLLSSSINTIAVENSVKYVIAFNVSSICHLSMSLQM